MLGIPRNIRPIGVNCAKIMLVAFLMAAALSRSSRGAEEATKSIAIAEVQHQGPVDFEGEILPILKKNCIACHNHATKKGELVLETPKTIRQGGASGPVVDPEAPDDSILLQVASHQSEPYMPPADNKVAAAPLTPEELGLMRLWIAEGAKGEVRDRAAAITWQPLPSGVNPIYAVAVTPDGQFAACGRANQIYIYHLPSGRFLCQLTDPALIDGVLYQKPGVAHRDLVHALAFSPDGYTLASGDYRVVKLWRRPRDVERLQLALEETSATTLAASPDGKLAALATADHRIRMWNLADGTSGPVLEGHCDRVSGIRFSGDGQRLFSASEDGSIRVWSVAGEAIARIDTPAAVEGLTLAAKGEQIVTAGADGLVRSWSIPNGVAAPLSTAPEAIEAMALQPGQKLLAMVCADGGVRLVDLESGQTQRELPRAEAPVTSLAFSPDATRLATGGADGQIRVWRLEGDEVPLVGNGPGKVTDLAWHPSGGEICSASTDGTLTVWSFEGAVAGSAPLKVVRQFAAGSVPVHAVLYADDGNALFAGDDAGKLVAFARADGAARFALTQEAAVNDLALARDGQTLVSAGRDGRVRYYKTTDGTALELPPADLGGGVTCLFVSPDGHRLVAGTEKHRAAVLDLASGIIEQFFGEHEAAVRGVALLSDSLVLTASADKTIRVRPMLALKRLAGHSGKATCVEALPGAMHVVSGGEDGTIREWDLETGLEVRKFEHGGPVRGLAVRFDGARLASAGTNGIVRLWQSADGAQLAEIKGDFKTQQLVALLTTRHGVAQGNANAAKSALDAAEKDKSERVAAVAAAEENQKKAIDALAEAETKSKAASEAKASADQLAADTAAKAKAAAEAKAASDKNAADLAAALALASESAAKAKAASDAASSATEATGALALATKSAAEKLTADPSMADTSAAAQKLAADVSVMDQSAKAIYAALAKIVEEKTASSQAAQEKKANDEKVLAEAEAAAKAAAEAKAAADKAAKEASDALTAAANNQQSADKALADAQRAAALAEELLPQRQSAYEEAAAIVAQFEKQLAAANAELPKYEQPIRALAFSPDGQLLAAAGDDSIIRAYRADDGSPFETFQAHKRPVTALSFVSEGALFSTGEDGTARLWDLYPVWSLAGQIGPSPDAPQALDTSVFADRVVALAFSPDGTLLATGGGEPSRGGEILVWNVTDRKIVLNLREAHSDTVFGLEFSPNGKYLASCGADKFVRVFELATGTQVRSFEGHTHHVLGVSWRADGKLLASCGADSVVKVWNFETGEQQRTMAGFGKEVTSVSFVGTSSTTLATSGDKTVRLHNVDDGRNTRTFTGAGDFLYCGRITADGRLIVAGGADSVLRVWNAADGKQLFAFEPPRP